MFESIYETMITKLPTPIFDKLAIIGIGLIGSSLARALRTAGVVRQISLYDMREDVRVRASELQLGEVCGDIGTAVQNADCVIVCVPVGASEAVAKAIAPHLKAGALVSDVGSVKGAVEKLMRPHLPQNVEFIGGHPVAGTEYSGPDAGFATLFEGRWSILTPPENANQDYVNILKVLWESVGAKVELMTTEHHDLVLAITSHLPHLIAYTTVGTADNLAKVTESEVIQYSAGGFRDFTRLAASDPTMWRDVFLHNKDAVLEMLGRFSEDLSALQRAIRYGEGDVLFDHFTHTRAIRRSIVQVESVKE